jgi:3-aminobutyryl-CoA ammonia-lyase
MPEADDIAAPSGYLRLRLGLNDTHYPNRLIPAATILKYFADCYTEIGIRMDGVDGYLVSYKKAEFLKPIFAGDLIEIRAELLSKGNRSRRIKLVARRCIAAVELGGGLSGGVLHEPPELVAEAIMIVVKPRSLAETEHSAPC